MTCIGGICRDREVLCARGRDDDRGGTLPAGMLYILVMLLLSVGLCGGGDLERPRCTDLTPLLSTLFFLSGSTFSPWRVSKLGRRLDAPDGFSVISVREVLRSMLFDRMFRGKVSAKLDSVTSRMSDKGRVLAQEEAMECPLGSLRLVPSMPPQPVLWLWSESGEARKDESLTLSGEGCRSGGWSLVGGGCECPDPFSSRPAISENVIAAYRQLLRVTEL